MSLLTGTLALVVALLPAGPALADPSPPGPDHRHAAQLARVWTASPHTGNIGSSPTYAGGSVYYTEDAFALSDPRTGELITRRDAATAEALPFEAPAVDALFLTQPTTDGLSIFTVSAYEQGEPVAHVRAYTLDGQDLWTRDLPGERFMLTVVVAGAVVVAAGEADCDETGDTGCKRTEVQAWSATEGEPLWQRTVAGGSPEIVAAAGVVVHTTGTLTSVDASTGQLLWEQAGVADGQIAADADRVYLAAGSLCAVQAASGKRRWCVTDRSYHSVTVDGRMVFTVAYENYPAGERQVVALSTAGRARWAVAARPTGPLTVANGVVYLQHYTQGDGPPLPHPVDPPTQLLALRSTTGAVLNRLAVSDGYSSGGVAVGDGRVFTTAYPSSVQAYEPTP